MQTYLVQRITHVFSNKLNAEFSVESVDYTLFNKVILRDVYIADQQGDSLLHSRQVTGHLNYMDLNDRELYFRKLEFNDARIRIHNDTSRNINIKFLVDALKRKDTTKPRMHLKFHDISINNSYLEYTSNKPPREGYGMDLNHMHLSNFNLNVDRLEADSGRVNFRIKKLGFTDKTGFELTKLSSDIFIGQNKAWLKNARIRTPYSFVNADSLKLNHNGYQNFKEFVDKVGFSLGIEHSNISFHDLAYFARPFHKIPESNVVLSGLLEGKVKNLRGKNVYVAMGEQTELKTDFSADGLPDIENTFLYIDIDRLNSGIQDLSIFNSFTSEEKNIKIPKDFENLGLINYSGNFTGFIEDFVAYGTLQTDLGEISTDISLKPKKKEELKISGNVQTKNFDISGLMNNSKLFGDLSMDVQLDGTVQKAIGFRAYTDGVIQKLELNNYNYKNIKLDGLLTDKKYDGSLKIEDPNITFDFSGGIDFSKEIPVFDFEARLHQAKLNKLNFVEEQDTTARLSVNLISNFRGNNLDNAQGTINFNRGELTKNGRKLDLNNLKINAEHKQDTHTITLRSDYIDASLIGQYRWTSVHQSLKNLFYDYMPVFIQKKQDTVAVKQKNNFEFNIDLKKTKKITEIFYPKYSISDGSNINLKYNGEKRTFDLSAESQHFAYNHYHLNNVNLESHSQDTIFSMIFNFKNLQFNPEEKTTYLNNYSLKSLSGNNKSKILIDWDDPDKNSSKGEFIALIDFLKPQNHKNVITKIFFLPGLVNIQGQKWHLAKSNITIDTSSIKFEKLRFQHQNQRMMIDGRITNHAEDTLQLDFSEIDLSNLNMLFPKQKVNLQGIINGSTDLADLYGKPTFQSNLKIDSLVFNKQNLGNAKLFSEWNPSQKTIWIDIESKRGNLKTIDFEGDYTPNTQLLDFAITLDKLRMDFLNPIMEKSFSDVKGQVSGYLNLQGTTQNPVFNGKLITQKLGFTIDYLQTRYNFTKILNVSDNKMIFDNVVLYDKFGNKSLVDGTLNFNKLKNLSYDFKLNSNDFLALNTMGTNNTMYYGDGFVSGLVNIQGNAKTKNLNIDASVNTEENTIINLPIGSSHETKKSKFITFTNVIEENPQTYERYSTDLSGIDLNFDLEVTPLAEIRLIFDPSLGDMIKASGRGNINMEVGQDGDFSIYGEYTIDEGDYMFSLKNVINKRFQIEQGSQIIWNGKPQDADIDVTAIYNVRTSLDNLLMDTTEFYQKRIPVECKIRLTEKLVNPNINFEIALPTADESTRARVQGAIGTEEELNKQFLSLLVLNTFMPAQQYLADQADQFDMGATSMAFTTSELLSNQLSHWLSQISNNWDIGINYQPGDQISRDQVEVALSTQLLNDRLIINGNVGTGGKYAQTSEVVGDFRVDWKLSKNGKLRLKFFNRNSDKLIYEETRYIQGAGLYYREEFNNIDELINNIAKNLSSKNKKENTSND